MEEGLVKVLIVAGGTGGHLFPGIRLLEEIRLQGLGEVLFITSCRKQDGCILRQKGIRFRTLPVIALQSMKVGAVLDFAGRLAVGTVASLYLVLRFRPSVVIGFGGYLSGPILLWASLLGIRTIIHEQNVYPGKTNRILASVVNRIAISFPETMQYFRRFKRKLICSGNPLRRGLKRVSKTGDTFTVLAMGGSQGSHALNRLIPEAVGLIELDKKKSLEMIHISGDREKDEVIRAYQDKEIKSRVFSFTEHIDRFYNECDFVIARAGATTVSELLYMAKPSILIPYPYGGAHQRFNARLLERKGSAVLIEEEGLTPEHLRDVIVGFMDRSVLTEMSARVKDGNNKDGSSILIKEIHETLHLGR
jgi:UDP-N-acetylglucosamine--N-acetylmuramyl-(pentapeptide) pyrophosphoryl-undecaprenol N-acetylglucosamine transferase